MQRFIAWEASGSVALLAATVVALAWANSPWSGSYEALLHLRLGFTLGGAAFSLDLHHWVNDGLMAVFFFVVGLEIKREVVLGRLSTWKGAALPVVAAIGGMVVPAALYVAFNGRGEGIHGWGIPVATDIAFALGVLTLLGSRVPLGLKVFLTALAIADDIGAVTVISVFYTDTVRLSALAGAAMLLLLLWVVGRWFQIRAAGPYAVLVVGVWGAILASGVHATVAGVLIAMLVPVRSRIEPEAFLSGAGEALRALHSGPLSRDSLVHDSALLEQLERLHEAAERFRPPAVAFERALHPFSTWVVLPVFAIFNAGVRLEGGGVGEALGHPVAIGTVVGLFVGKQIGITLSSWLVLRLGLAKLPEGITLRHVYGASVVAGIGFTMSIFVAELAFTDPVLVASAKLGILAASVLAGVAGYLVLLFALRPG